MLGLFSGVDIISDTLNAVVIGVGGESMVVNKSQNQQSNLKFHEASRKAESSERQKGDVFFVL